MAAVQTRKAAIIVAGILMLLAFGLRFYHLDRQSLWSDEGNSVVMASRSLPDILQRTTNDPHPPLYSVLLHAWVQVWGNSVVAVRSLSVLFGTLTVLCLGFLGAKLAGRSVGLAVMGWASVSPLLVHFSQETRMYSLAVLLTVVSWWCLIDWLEGNYRSGWLYSLATLALIYSHYYGVFVLIAQWLWWFVTAIKRRTTVKLWQWFLAQLVIAVIYVPWLWAARDTLLNRQTGFQSVGLGSMAVSLAQFWTRGTAIDAQAWWWNAGFGVLALAGLLWLWQARRWNGFSALVMMAVPTGLVALASIARPSWQARFLMFGLPGFLLLLAFGSVWLIQRRQRFAPFVLVALVGFATLAVNQPLRNEYSNPRFWRDDYRAIAQYLAARITPEDVIILDNAGQNEIFDYYFPDQTKRILIPERQPMDVQATITQLEATAQRFQRLWVVWWGEVSDDPQLVIPQWFREHTIDLGSTWYGTVRLSSYWTQPLPDLAPRTEQFRNDDVALELLQIGISAQPTVGSSLIINSQWRTLQSNNSVPLLFFAQLLDQQQHIVAQYTGDGGAGALETWQPEQPIRLGFDLPPATPAGQYRLVMGVFQADTGLRLQTATSDVLDLGMITLMPATQAFTVEALDLRANERFDVLVGQTRLIGAHIRKQGQEYLDLVDANIKAGDQLVLRLFWRNEQAAPLPPNATITLERLWHEHARWDIDQSTQIQESPNAMWSSIQHVQLPANLSAGTYRLVLHADQSLTLTTFMIH